MVDDFIRREQYQMDLSMARDKAQADQKLATERQSQDFWQMQFGRLFFTICLIFSIGMVTALLFRAMSMYEHLHH